MNLQENIKILKSIAKKIANKLHCDRHGSCVHFAEIFVEEVNEEYPELLNDFDVIEGYVNVKFGDGIPQEHTWIKLNNGDIIDPTFSQFDKYDKNAQYSKKRTKVYSGQEYYDEGKEGSWFSERRKKLPSSVFKEEKRESIRRILREETYSPAGDEYTPGRYVVHKSPPQWRKNIGLRGLQVSVGECYENHVMGLYGEWYTECQPAIFATDSLNEEDMFDSTYNDDTWLIDTECAGVSWYIDAHFESDDYSHHIVTFEDISPDCLKLIHKGTGKSW